VPFFWLVCCGAAGFGQAAHARSCGLGLSIHLVDCHLMSQDYYSFEPDLSTQVDQIMAALKAKPGAYLVSITGIPGSGKSTLCAAIAKGVAGAAVLPMDGYHIPRSRLSPADMKRRGAPHTFDAGLFRDDLKALRKNRKGSFPAFDHAVKDPEPDAIRVESEASMVFVEGNYLLLSDWGLADIFDFIIFVDCDVDVAMERIVQRLYECGICATLEEAAAQVKTNDLLNAQLILDDGTAARADVCVYQNGTS
jgi:pantothenate kinase